jgi:molybdate transport system substrate-binding protein
MNARICSWILVVAFLASISGAVGCTRAHPPASASEDELVVFAAASLRDAFTVLQRDFEGAHPGVELSFNFTGTQELRTQIEHGATLDVFASADQRHMDELVRASRVSAPITFARNEPVIVVAREAAHRIHELADLATASRIVIGTNDVPIGRYTLEILDRASASLGADFRARLEARVVSRELNVRQVLAKVSLGEAEAGVVYRTDAEAARGGVSIVTIPPHINVVAEYPIAVIRGAAHPKLARAWVELVCSPEGQGVLRRAGFMAPARIEASP